MINDPYYIIPGIIRTLIIISIIIYIIRYMCKINRKLDTISKKIEELIENKKWYIFRLKS